MPQKTWNTDEVITEAAKQSKIDASVMAIVEVPDKPGTFTISLYNGKIIEVTMPGSEPPKQPEKPAPVVVDLETAEPLGDGNYSAPVTEPEAAVSELPESKKSGKIKK